MPVLTEQTKKPLAAQIEKYLNQHSVSRDMNTIYMLDAFTLRTKPSKIVLVMDAVRANGTHVSYNDYINNQDPENWENNDESFQTGRHFNYVSHSTHGSMIKSVN